MNRHVSCLVQNQSSPAMFTCANTWDCRWRVNFTLWRYASRGSGDFPLFTRSESESFRKTETCGNFHMSKRGLSCYMVQVFQVSHIKQVDKDLSVHFQTWPWLSKCYHILSFLRKSHFSRNVFITWFQVSKCVCEKHLKHHRQNIEAKSTERESRKFFFLNLKPDIRFIFQLPMEWFTDKKTKDII